ncbi:NADPH-dependent F420 reductase [Nonomuraea monospora]
MRIGILGAGGMADALGTQWARAGHEVMVSGRDLSRSTAQAARMSTAAASAPSAGAAVSASAGTGVVAGVAGAGVVAEVSRAGERGRVLAGSFAEVAEFGEVVVVAVREAGLLDTLHAAGLALRGKALIDVTNAANPKEYDITHSLARLIGEVSGGHVVKAFNLCHVDVWRMTPPVFDGRPLAVPLCGDDPGALTAARTLVTDLGCTPVDGGGAERAALLEATAAFMIGLWFSGADAQAVLPPLPSSGTHQPA